MAPPKIREAPPDKVDTVEGEEEEVEEVEEGNNVEEPPAKRYKRSKQVLRGSNKDTRSDTEGSQVGYYGNDGPLPYANQGLALFVASDSFLDQQNDLRQIRLEIEAKFNDEKKSEMREKLLKQLRKELNRGKQLDAEEWGRKEFERRKGILRREMERELRPKIEKEVREIIERERAERKEAERVKGREGGIDETSGAGYEDKLPAL